MSPTTVLMSGRGRRIRYHVVLQHVSDVYGVAIIGRRACRPLSQPFSRRDLRQVGMSALMHKFLISCGSMQRLLRLRARSSASAAPSPAPALTTVAASRRAAPWASWVGPKMALSTWLGLSGIGACRGSVVWVSVVWVRLRQSGLRHGHRLGPGLDVLGQVEDRPIVVRLRCHPMACLPGRWCALRRLRWRDAMLGSLGLSRCFLPCRRPSHEAAPAQRRALST
jgi:hypothetical protein